MKRKVSNEILKKQVQFYDPHPGFRGAIAPLPSPMKSVASQLDGLNMTLEEAMKLIGPVAKRIRGEASIVNKLDPINGEKIEYISFKYSSGPFTHGYRLISYREVE